ncbi:hypothetical protein VNO78_27249 [Psophocarpus tetragonolobus]|uniref:Uncharacterized protein n=1 Tax=Psophocarpus tetragonolobus TaxID=3891 RepID=A0AAN9S1E4_PSOTE
MLMVEGPVYVQKFAYSICQFCRSLGGDKFVKSDVSDSASSVMSKWEGDIDAWSDSENHKAALGIDYEVLKEYVESSPVQVEENGFTFRVLLVGSPRELCASAGAIPRPTLPQHQINHMLKHAVGSSSESVEEHQIDDQRAPCEHSL